MLDPKSVIPGVSEYRQTERDDAALDKMLAFWAQCKGSLDKGKTFNTWTVIIRNHHGELIDALESGDRERLAKLYSNFWVQPFTYGYAQAAAAYKRFLSDGNQTANLWAAAIPRLADAVGASMVVRESDAKAQSIDEYSYQISARTGVEFGIPAENSAGMCGTWVNGKLINIKDTQGYLFAYQASKVRGGDTVCEVGTGCGHTSYYHTRFGAKRVYMFDLPTVAVSAIWVLARLEGVDTICIPGEDLKPSHKYVLYPHFSFGEPETSFMHFDTLVNKISFPEMGTDIASDYIRKSVFYGCNRVYSMNYESEHSVIKLSADEPEKKLGRVADAAAKAGWRPVTRSPSWIGKGFLDEIFVTPETFR